MKRTIRCIVTGRVQGVFFRASTRAVAQQLGIRGHAINLANGSVEVIAYGTAEQLECLREFLVTGPEHADVQHLDCQELPSGEFELASDFTTG